MPRASLLSVWPSDSASEVSQSESEDTCRAMSLSEAEFWQAPELRKAWGFWRAARSMELICC